MKVDDQRHLTGPFGPMLEDILTHLKGISDVLGAAVIGPDGSVLAFRNYNGYRIDDYLKGATAYDAGYGTCTGIGGMKVLIKELEEGLQLRVFLSPGAFTMLADLDLEGLLRQRIAG